MSKTPGQIAFEAAGEACPTEWPTVEFSELKDYGKAYWETAANAIIEECAKIADDDDGDFTWAGEHRNMVLLQTCAKEIAAAIRALKAPTPGE